MASLRAFSPVSARSANAPLRLIDPLHEQLRRLGMESESPGELPFGFHKRDPELAAFLALSKTRSVVLHPTIALALVRAAENEIGKRVLQTHFSSERTDRDRSHRLYFGLAAGSAVAYGALAAAGALSGMAVDSVLVFFGMGAVLFALLGLRAMATFDPRAAASRDLLRNLREFLTDSKNQEVLAQRLATVEPGQRP